MRSRMIVFFFAMTFSGCAATSKSFSLCPQLESPPPPILMSANLTDKSTYAEIEKAHLIDLINLSSYSKNLKNIIDATN